MRQTTLSVPLEVKPQSCAYLTALIDQLKQQEDKGSNPEIANFHRLVEQVPVLHFMSMSVFPAAEYDPLFILEANFDGAPGPFWAQLEAVLGSQLREMIRCCKRPLDGQGPLYDAVTEPNSGVPIAPYLEALTQNPSVYFHGNRGLTRDCILADYALFLELRDELDNPAGGAPYRGLDPVALQSRLRAALLPAFGWLNEPEPVRITLAQNLSDWARMIRYLLIVLLTLSSPGLLLASLLSVVSDVKVLTLAMVLLLGGILLISRHRRSTDIHTKFKVSSFLLRQVQKMKLLIQIMLLLVFYVIGAVAVLDIGFLIASGFLYVLEIIPLINFNVLGWRMIVIVLMGLASLVLLTLPLLLLLVRIGELRDSSQDAPLPNERMLEDMLAREDWITQNHMGSIVLIKPGILRSIIIRTGHLGLFLLLRLQKEARDGYLGSMRTVHFAHWAFLNNGSRLLFFSNFDHSWSSYLDDFIEKAHAGLTLAWGCGVGFPPTRFLLFDGASHGRQFKAWALASRAVSRFWYSAYPDLTVDLVERNHRIANGLRKTQLQPEEAKTWMLDL